MEDVSRHAVPPKFWLLFLPAIFVIYAVFSVQGFHAAGGELAASATYTHGILDVTLPYHSPHAGSGKLMLEILNPEDETIGRTDRGIEVAEGNGIWREQIKLAKSLAVDELVGTACAIALNTATAKPQESRASNRFRRSSAHR